MANKRMKLTCKEKMVIALSILGLSCIFTEECEFSRIMEQANKVRPAQYTEQPAALVEHKCLDGVCTL